MKKIMPLVLVVMVWGTGCAHYKCAEPCRPAEPLPPLIAEACKYEKQPIVYDSHITRRNSHYYVMRASLLVPRMTDACSTNIVEWKVQELEVYVPWGIGKFPVILMLPISSKRYYAERFNANCFVKRGYIVVILRHEEYESTRSSKKGLPPIIKQVFHLVRLVFVHITVDPHKAEKERRKEEAILKRASPEEVDIFLRQAVSDCQRTIDWAEAQPEFDTDRIVAFGLSQGGIKLISVMAVEPRIKAGFDGISGEGVSRIIRDSRERSVADGRRIYLKYHPGMTLDGYEAKLRETLIWDYLAPCIGPHRLCLALAKWDDVVPYPTGLELKLDARNPEYVEVLSKHYGVVFYVFYFQDVALDFFKRRLDECAGSHPLDLVSAKK